MVDGKEADASIDGRKSAVGAVVTIVAHHENIAGWDLHDGKIITGASVDLIQHRVTWAAGECLEKCAISAECSPRHLKHNGDGWRDGTTRAVGADRDPGRA